MPKQCPECRSIASEDIGFCPACACQLGTGGDPWQSARQWQQMAAGIALGAVAGTMLYFWWVALHP
ncbi:MAG TPA: hypothetical protein VKX49_23700 [Bryobacteraceae bacterium]|nr:hypothetical protein [Bryobacteraceae bacterium]